MPIQLKPHNVETYGKVKEKFKQSKRVAIIHPTGTGKSYLALKLLEENKDKNAIYIAPSTAILHNIKKNIFESGMDMTDFPKFKRITYQKLMKLSDEEIEKLGSQIIILDEFHHCGAPEWGDGVRRLLEKNPEANVLGLSATPIRYFDNGRDMAEELFKGNIASEMTLEEAIEKGILPEATYVSALYGYDDELDGMQRNIDEISNKEKKQQAQDLHKELKQKLDENMQKLPDLLSEYMTNKSGKYLVFCRNLQDMNEKIQTVQDIFSKVNSNIQVYSVSSEDDIKKNDRTLSKFEQDRKEDSLKLLFSVNMLNEGYHIENLDGVIMMRPTFSPTIYTQQLGRALSVKKDNGNPPVILDLVNNFDSCKIIEDFYERMKQYSDKSGDGRAGTNRTKSRISIFDKTKEFREIAKKITELCKKRTTTLDEKIEIFIRFNETGEELNGQTVFEGYPIGQWAIQIRSTVNNDKITVTNEQLEKLNEMGILERGIDSTIDEKIQFLVDWIKDYPQAKLVGARNIKKILEQYAYSSSEYNELMSKYHKAQSYYKYVQVRKTGRKINTRARTKMPRRECGRCFWNS